VLTKSGKGYDGFPRKLYIICADSPNGAISILANKRNGEHQEKLLNSIAGINFKLFNLFLFELMTSSRPICVNPICLLLNKINVGIYMHACK